MSDVTELFNRDPLEYTNEDLDKIITTWRSQRAKMAAQPAAAPARTPKKLTPEQAKLKNAGLGLSL